MPVTTRSDDNTTRRPALRQPVESGSNDFARYTRPLSMSSPSSFHPLSCDKDDENMIPCRVHGMGTTIGLRALEARFWGSGERRYGGEVVDRT